MRQVSRQLLNSQTDSKKSDHKRKVQVQKQGMRGKEKKKESSKIFLVLLMLLGIGLMAYPSVSNYWTESHAARVISDYTEAENNLSRSEYETMWEEALAYNQEPVVLTRELTLGETTSAKYNSLLNLLGNGEMGYIEIPSLKVNLPIYHGTSDSVLSVAVGHLEWSSLPVGGEGTHCVLSGHRGLPSARLFTDLDAMKEGDTFQLHILGKILTYEVDQILIVEPSDTTALQPEEGKDYCTLLTCTPYGINTHRLLVRGHRVDNPEEDASLRVISEAVQFQPTIVAGIIAGVALIVILIVFSMQSPAPSRTRTDSGKNVSSSESHYTRRENSDRKHGRKSDYTPPWKY